MLWKEIPEVFGKYEMSETGMVRNKRTRVIIKLNLNKKDDGTYRAVYFLRTRNGSRVFHLKNLLARVHTKEVVLDEKFLLDLSDQIEKEKKTTIPLKYRHKHDDNKMSLQEEYDELIDDKFDYRTIEPFLEMERPETDPFAFYSFSKHE